MTSRCLGGQDWAPEDSHLDEVSKAAMIVNLLTEDNLPSYHREIALRFGPDGAWGQWVGQWTAEEGRHSIAIRDYLVVTRGVDPVALERGRMVHMAAGYDSGDKSMLEALAYVSFQGLATRVSGTQHGRASGCPIANQLLARIAADENLHMVFYRNLMAAALDIAPDAAMRAICDEVVGFTMPGAGMTDLAREFDPHREGRHLRPPLTFGRCSCVRCCGSGECSSVTISTVKELAREMIWRPFSIWWRPRPHTMSNVAKNDWPEQVRRPVADCSNRCSATYFLGVVVRLGSAFFAHSRLGGVGELSWWGSSPPSRPARSGSAVPRVWGCSG